MWGGIDMKRFLQSENELRDFECAVCLAVLDKPIVLECGHLFWSSCLLRHWRPTTPTRHKCPYCRIAVSRVNKPNFHYRNMLVRLLLRCAYDGCRHIIRLEKNNEHARICGKRMMKCPHSGCDAQLKQKDLLLHLRRHTKFCTDCSGTCKGQRTLIGLAHCYHTKAGKLARITYLGLN